MRVSNLLGLGRLLPLTAVVLLATGPTIARGQPAPAQDKGEPARGRPASEAGAADQPQATPPHATPADTATSDTDGTRQARAEQAEEKNTKPHGGDADITIDLKPTAIIEGHDLRATVKVQPDTLNRLLAVRIDAPTFYASTERELMGAASPRTYTFKWEKLPAGLYRVEAIVTDAAGRLTRVHRDFQVHGGTIEGEWMPPTPRRRGRRGRQ